MDPINYIPENYNNNLLFEENQLIYRDESYQILGACFEVYKEKGNGFLEAIYQECLGLELSIRGISFIEKPALSLYYKNTLLKQTYQPDFLCFDKILLEIKAVKEIADEHRAQAINYLKSTGLRLCMLVNFGHYPKVQHERFLNQ